MSIVTMLATEKISLLWLTLTPVQDSAMLPITATSGVFTPQTINAG